MKKAIVVFGLGVMLFGLSLGQASSAQMQMGTQPSSALPQEIHLLKVINQAGLTKAQLGEFQGLLSGMREAQQAIVQRQQELKAFLVAWQGTPDEFSAALQPVEAQVQQANQALEQEQQNITSKLKKLLSYYQGETLLGGLREMTAASSQMPMPMDMQSMMQQMQNGMHAMMQGRQQMPIQGMGNGQQDSKDQVKQPEMAAEGSHQAHHPEQNNGGQMDQSGMMENGNMQKGMQEMMQMHQQMMTRMQAMQGAQMGSMMMQANWGAILLQNLDLLEQAIAEKVASL